VSRVRAIIRRAAARVAFAALTAGTLAPAANAAGPVLVVRSSDLKPYKAVEDAFLEGMAELGRPTRTLTLTAAGGTREEVKAAIAGASLVLAVGKEAARMVADLHAGVPTIYTLVPDPAAAGLERDAPGVNMYVSPATQLSAIKSALPHARKLGVLYDPSNSQTLVAACEAAAKTDGFTLVERVVTSREQVASTARDLLQQVDALWLVPDTTVVSADTFKFLVQTSLESKVPVIGFSEGMTRVGALLSVEAAHIAMGRKAADMARRILAGDHPHLESPDGRVTLNLKSAQLLGISIPTAVRERARVVSE